MLKKILLTLFLLYSIIGFFVLPLILKSQIIERVNQETKAKLSINDVYFNPYIFKLELSAVKLNDLDKKHLLSFKSLLVDVEPSSLLQAALHVSNITLTKPQISLVYNRDRTFNLASIVKEEKEEKDEAKEEPLEMPRVIIDNIAIIEGGLDYEDYTNKQKYEFSVDSIGFRLQSIDTSDLESSGATMRFNSALGDGGEIDFRSEVVGFKPLVIKGRLDFKASKLYTQWRYFQDKLGIEVANGRLSVGADYFVNVDDLSSTLIDNIELSLEELRIKPKNRPDDILNLDSLHVKDVTLKPMQQELHVDAIDMSTLKIKFKKDNAGNIDWIEYLKNGETGSNSLIQPPLKTYTLSLGSATTKLDLEASTDAETSETTMNIKDIDLHLNSLELKREDVDEKLVDFDSLKIDGVNVNTKTRELDIEKVALNTLGVYAKKYKNGEINFNYLGKTKVEKGEKDDETVKDEKPYRVKLKHFNVDSAKVAFVDESISKATTTTLDSIDVNVYNIDSIEKNWLDYDISMLVNNKGRVSSKGSVSHTPLKQNGTFSVERVSLKEITPYLQESMYLALTDGHVSLNSKLSYSKYDKRPDLHVDGKLKIEDLELVDSRSRDRLLTFTKTELKSFELNMFPNNLHIDEVGLDTFYVDAQIDEKKQMNFAKLSKAKSDGSELKKEETNSTASDTSNPFPLKIMKIHVNNGAANFADYSLPIKFKTSIHNLNGGIYAISNSKGEISYIDIGGEVDKYGSTKLKGSIEASDFKSLTDIGFSFKNLNLDSYSGYSAQFTGHKIEKGKLFLDLGYKIHDSNILGSNNLIIKNIELGDTIEDENITKLPLGFAIALLEDTDGVIDIDMPVQGDMSEPDFKYGALVVKTFANLIVKAVASPFKFLGAAMGIDGDELRYIDFNPSGYLILPSEREKLDNIAKILIKKQKLSLDILSSYNLELDKKAMQVDKLTSKVKKRSGEAVMRVDVLEEIYKESVGDDIAYRFKEELEKKHEDNDKMFNSEYHKELFSRCTSIQEVSLEELQDLATVRATLLRAYLVEEKKIDPARVIATRVHISEESDDKWAKTELKIVVK